MMASPDPVLGANALRSRSHNRQLVLGQVRAAGRIGRADIARASGLSTQAVSNIIADLLEDGMILERGRRPASRGLPPVQYGINPRGGFALGVEIRPDTVLAALMDLTGHILFSDRRPLADSGRATVTRTLQAIRSRAVAETGIDPARVLGAGIVMPGPFGATGIRDSGSELPRWEDTDPRQWFAQALGLPVAVENDANAAAMAERIAGAAQGLDSYAFLYFGTGLGLGVVSQGRLLTGAFGNAGEIGHVPMPGAEGPIPLEDVRSEVVLAWQSSEMQAQLRARAEGLKAALEAGDMAALDEVEIQTAENVGRGQMLPNTPASLNNHIFEMEEGAVDLVEGAEKVVIVRLDGVSDPDMESEEVTQMRGFLEQQAASQTAEALFQAYLEALRSDAGVQLNQAALNAVKAQFQ